MAIATGIARQFRPLRLALSAVLALALFAPAAFALDAQQLAQSPQSKTQPEAQAGSAVTLSASAVGDPAPIRHGLQWRVFAATPDAGAREVAESLDANPTFTLPAGEYVVHAALGLASGSKRIRVEGTPLTEQVSINAGGLTVNAAIGDVPIPAAKISLSVYIPAPGNSEDRLVTSSLKAGELLLLPEGTYHIVSNYGDTNSIMRADIAVKVGKVVAATMMHRAATVTLKLVHKAGGEAVADTGWTILTPGGDVIREAIGAFPSITLAEGNYIAIARHDGRVYQGEFEVRSGIDHDVEVTAKDPPAAAAQ
jgi:hypothetical protein